MLFKNQSYVTFFSREEPIPLSEKQKAYRNFLDAYVETSGLPSHVQIVEIGCGEATEAPVLLHHFEKNAWVSYFGVDRDCFSLCKAARRYGNLQFRFHISNAAISTHGFPESMDVLVINHPNIYREGNWAQILEKVSKIHKPNGLLISTFYTEIERKQFEAISGFFYRGVGGKSHYTAEGPIYNSYEEYFVGRKV